MPLQNRVTPFGDLSAVRTRDVHGQSRRPLSHRRPNADGAALGVAAMDLLRARFQGPPARRVGPLLHRAVLPRRADRACGRTSALLRVPPQGRRALPELACREKRAGSRAAEAGEMDEVLHDERLCGRAKRVHRRNIDALPDGAFIALDEGAFAVRGDGLLRWTPEVTRPPAAAAGHSRSTCLHRRRFWRCCRPATAALAPKREKLTRHRRLDGLDAVRRICARRR